jgi:hypothetical protein
MTNLESPTENVYIPEPIIVSQSRKEFHGIRTHIGPEVQEVVMFDLLKGHCDFLHGKPKSPSHFWRIGQHTV